MPLKNYGVLKGRAIDRRLASGANAHYQVKLVDDEFEWRIAINVQSADSSEVEYAVISRFLHPITDALQALDTGFSPLPASEAGGLDYIRGNLIDPGSLIPLPMNLPGPDNDLNEKLDHYIQRAMADENSTIYAFGETWGPETKRDKIFGFLPGRGIHDIHMNQGNDGHWKKDNGVWQDGGLIMSFPGSPAQWVAIFLKFQTQAWHTDDSTGHPADTEVSGPPSDKDESETIDTDSLPTPERPDGLVRIIGALVNDISSPERETVTLLNTGPQDIDLAGWHLLDSQKHKLALQGILPKGETRMIEVRPEVQLSNRGGIITLINQDGLKVHGVSYTRQKAQNPGWTITFC